MTPLTESELAEVAVALHNLAYTPSHYHEGYAAELNALYAKIAALNEGADK